jgi:hypothetical protein
MRRALVGVLLVALVLTWWVLPAPRNDRDWQPDVAVLPWAAFDGDLITVHNVRNNAYRGATEYTPRWEDRTYALSTLRTADLFLSSWGAPGIVHTILSFGFDDGRYLAISVETRKEKGEEYSAIKGFLRQYELIYVVADERDVVGVRANHRGEDVRLYRLLTPVATARDVFTAQLRHINRLHDHPEWYNALTHNCTTALRGDARPYAARSWASWKLLLNAYVDELAYDIGAIDRTLPLAELRARSRINGRALAADGAPDFSERIRDTLPGMTASGAD